MAFFIVDFWEQGKYAFLAGPISAIYLSILGLFAGVKEMDRWRGQHFSRYLGEYFVVLWTMLLVVFFIIVILTNKFYYISNELITVYIAVLGIFALTQKSKKWYKNK